MCVFCGLLWSSFLSFLHVPVISLFVQQLYRWLLAEFKAWQANSSLRLRSTNVSSSPFWVVWQWKWVHLSFIWCINEQFPNDCGQTKAITKPVTEATYVPFSDNSWNNLLIFTNQWEAKINARKKLFWNRHGVTQAKTTDYTCFQLVSSLYFCFFSSTSFRFPCC